jgi:hypothetical protein
MSTKKIFPMTEGEIMDSNLKAILKVPEHIRLSDIDITNLHIILTEEGYRSGLKFLSRPDAYFIGDFKRRQILAPNSTMDITFRDGVFLDNLMKGTKVSLTNTGKVIAAKINFLVHYSGLHDIPICPYHVTSLAEIPILCGTFRLCKKVTRSDLNSTLDMD